MSSSPGGDKEEYLQLKYSDSVNFGGIDPALLDEDYVRFRREEIEQRRRELEISEMSSRQSNPYSTEYPDLEDPDYLQQQDHPTQEFRQQYGNDPSQQQHQEHLDEEQHQDDLHQQDHPAQEFRQQYGDNPIYQQHQEYLDEEQHQDDLLQQHSGSSSPQQQNQSPPNTKVARKRKRAEDASEKKGTGQSGKANKHYLKSKYLPWYRCPGCDLLQESRTRIIKCIEKHLDRHDEDGQVLPAASPIENDTGREAFAEYLRGNEDERIDFLNRESLKLLKSEHDDWVPFKTPFLDPENYPLCRESLKPKLYDRHRNLNARYLTKPELETPSLPRDHHLYLSPNRDPKSTNWNPMESPWVRSMQEELARTYDSESEQASLETPSIIQDAPQSKKKRKSKSGGRKEPVAPPADESDLRTSPSFDKLLELIPQPPPFDTLMAIPISSAYDSLMLSMSPSSFQQTHGNFPYESSSPTQDWRMSHESPYSPSPVGRRADGPSHESDFRNHANDSLIDRMSGSPLQRRMQQASATYEGSFPRQTDSMMMMGISRSPAERHMQQTGATHEGSFPRQANSIMRHMSRSPSQPHTQEVGSFMHKGGFPYQTNSTMSRISHSSSERHMQQAGNTYEGNFTHQPDSMMSRMSSRSPSQPHTQKSSSSMQKGSFSQQADFMMGPMSSRSPSHRLTQQGGFSNQFADQDLRPNARGLSMRSQSPRQNASNPSIGSFQSNPKWVNLPGSQFVGQPLPQQVAGYKSGSYSNRTTQSPVAAQFLSSTASSNPIKPFQPRMNTNESQRLSQQSNDSSRFVSGTQAPFIDQDDGSSDRGSTLTQVSQTANAGAPSQQQAGGTQPTASAQNETQTEKKFRPLPESEGGYPADVYKGLFAEDGDVIAFADERGVHTWREKK